MFLSLLSGPVQLPFRRFAGEVRLWDFDGSTATLLQTILFFNGTISSEDKFENILILAPNRPFLCIANTCCDALYVFHLNRFLRPRRNCCVPRIDWPDVSIAFALVVSVYMA